MVTKKIIRIIIIKAMDIKNSEKLVSHLIKDMIMDTKKAMIIIITTVILIIKNGKIVKIVIIINIKIEIIIMTIKK